MISSNDFQLDLGFCNLDKLKRPVLCDFTMPLFPLCNHKDDKHCIYIAWAVSSAWDLL